MSFLKDFYKNMDKVIIPTPAGEFDLLASLIKTRSYTLQKPSKTGMQTRSPKLVIKEGSNNFTIIQRKNKGYIKYTFNTANGDTGASSVGGSWDLLRLKKAQGVGIAYVAKDAYSSYTGNLTTLTAEGEFNNIEEKLFPTISTYNGYVSSKGSGNGLRVLGIDNTGSTCSVKYTIKPSKSKKANIVVYGSPASSASADILVNGEVVKSFNPSKLSIATVNHYKVIEFEIPFSYGSGSDLEIELRNNDTTGKKLYFSCVNFYELKDYNGQSIDMWKYITTDELYIDAGGASDYAIFDKDIGKWCGSYHGGETRIYSSMPWVSSYDLKFDEEWRMTQKEITDASIANGAWIVTNDFRFVQITNLNNKGTMISYFDFNIDGTIEMDFSLQDCSIKTTDFYTALTCGHISLNYIMLPIYATLTGTGKKVNIKEDNGHIVQYAGTGTYEMHIRYSKFISAYDVYGSYVLDHASFYKKFYQGIVTNYETGVVIPNLSFSKGLDFYKR